MSRAAWPTPLFATSPRRCARLADGGRLVAITGANFGPDAPAWRDAFVRLQERGRIVFTAAIDGAVYAKHGTTIDTRLTVIDKVPAENPAALPASPGMAPDVATLLDWIAEHVPTRLPLATGLAIPDVGCRRTADGARLSRARRMAARTAKPSVADPEAVDLAYETHRLDAARGRASQRCDL